MARGQATVRELQELSYIYSRMCFRATGMKGLLPLTTGMREHIERKKSGGKDSIMPFKPRLKKKKTTITILQ